MSKDYYENSPFNLDKFKRKQKQEMKEMKLIEHNNYLEVEVPEGASEFIIKYGELISYVNGYLTSATPLPPGNYAIVGLAKDLTKEQKLEIEPKGTAAFNRLLDDNGLKDSTTLIIKKIV